MSKRAEKRALEFVPVGQIENHPIYTRKEVRKFVEKTYEQAEKDTIERAVEWLKVHAEDYIVNMTGSYPDAPFNAIIGGKCWDELKKAMEKNNG